MSKGFLNNLERNVLVVHTCCADCFLNTIDYLKENSLIKNNCKTIALYFNPNIHPRSEYVARLNALKKVASEDVEIVVPDYKPKEYFDSIEGKPKRCLGCWELRLRRLFEFAKEKGYANLTTTLLVSQYQNREEILEIAREINKEYNLNFIEVDSSHNCNRKGFYKQNFCGCCFSLVERMLEKN